MPLKYISTISIGPNQTYEIFHPKSLDKNPPNSDKDESITLKITTPLFYALIALDSNPATFLSSSVQPSSPHPPTFHTSHPAIFAALFSPSQLSAPTSSASTDTGPFTSRPRWSLLDWFRHTPHLLDQHSIRLGPSLERQYRTTVLKLLLSDALFLGLPIIVDVLSVAVKVALCYMYASTLSAVWPLYGLPSTTAGSLARALWSDILALMGIHVWRLLSTALEIVI